MLATCSSFSSKIQHTQKSLTEAPRVKRTDPVTGVRGVQESLGARLRSERNRLNSGLLWGPVFQAYPSPRACGFGCTWRFVVLINQKILRRLYLTQGLWDLGCFGVVWVAQGVRRANSTKGYSTSPTLELKRAGATFGIASRFSDAVWPCLFSLYSCARDCTTS